MKKILWISLIVLGSLILISISVGIIKALNIKKSIEDKEYQIIDDYESIIIDTDIFDVNVILSETENKVVYKEAKHIGVTCTVNNRVLNIKEIDKRLFFGRFFNFSNFKVDLYLSKSQIQNLKIDGDTGNINVYEGFTFNKVEIENSTGNVSFQSNVDDYVDIEVSTGNIKLRNSNILGGVEIEASTGNIELTNSNMNNLDIEISTGKCKLTNVQVFKDLTIDGSTGDVIFDGIDASNIFVELSTGDVRGTILSGKWFNVESDTGKVSIPQSKEGGECRIKVDTGDIAISYK